METRQALNIGIMRTLLITLLFGSFFESQIIESINSNQWQEMCNVRWHTNCHLVIPHCGTQHCWRISCVLAALFLSLLLFSVISTILFEYRNVFLIWNVEVIQFCFQQMHRQKLEAKFYGEEIIDQIPSS